MMASTTEPTLGPLSTRGYVAALKAAHLTHVTFALVPKGNGHGLDAGAVLTTSTDPQGIRIAIRHGQDGNLRASYGTEPSQALPTVDHPMLARIRGALDSLERIRNAAEDLYRARMQEVGVRLAYEYTERLMAAQASGDASFDVLAELPREDLFKSGMRTVADLNALAGRHT